MPIIRFLHTFFLMHQSIRIEGHINADESEFWLYEVNKSMINMKAHIIQTRGPPLT